MNQTLNIITKAFISGFLVGIGGILYISAQSQIVGSILFSFALILIVSRGYYLFTGKIGYLLPYEKGYAKMIGKTLLGNVLGVLFIAGLFLLSGKDIAITQAETLVSYKLDQTWYQTLVLAIFCGFMMYLAVDSYHKIKNDISALAIVIFAVVIFIISGFEHSIADMVYFTIARSFSFQSLLFIIIVLIGNMIGSVFLNLLHTIIKEKS